MDIAPAFEAIAETIRSIPRSELLIAAVAAMLAGFVGGILARRKVAGGRLISTLSTLTLGAILITVVLQLSRFDPRLDVAVPGLGLPEQTVVGEETRIPMAADGHFWLQAEVNGVKANFLIDTGATLTAVSPDVAELAGLTPRRAGIPVRIKTANGAVNAQMTTIDRLQFGSVEASGIDAVIAPTLGETNVLGMNVLSRLTSWRVENQTMIFVPPEGGI
jgi:aspartyl protease family protein